MHFDGAAAMVIKRPPKSSPRRFFESVAWGVFFAVAFFAVTALFRRFLKTQIGSLIVTLLSANIVFLFYLMIYICFCLSLYLI